MNGEKKRWKKGEERKGNPLKVTNKLGEEEWFSRKSCINTKVRMVRRKIPKKEGPYEGGKRIIEKKIDISFYTGNGTKEEKEGRN